VALGGPRVWTDCDKEETSEHIDQTKCSFVSRCMLLCRLTYSQTFLIKTGIIPTLSCPLSMNKKTGIKLSYPIPAGASSSIWRKLKKKYVSFKYNYNNLWSYYNELSQKDGKYQGELLKVFQINLDILSTEPYRKIKKTNKGVMIVEYYRNSNSLKD